MQGLLVKVLSIRYTDACFVGISRTTSADIEGNYFSSFTSFVFYHVTHTRARGGVAPRRWRRLAPWATACTPGCGTGLGSVVASVGLYLSKISG